MAGAIRQHETMSLDDFEELLLDKPENEKWELIGGRVVRGMVGARWEHKQIVLNLTLAINNRLRESRSRCRAYDETFWLKEKSLDLGVFPDLMVFCNKLDPGDIATSQPVVLIEVLSAGSEARDRFEKWGLYQQLPSLRHHVLVDRDRMHVEVFSRGEAEWEGFRSLQTAKARLELPAIDFALPLADIYWDTGVDGTTGTAS
jgi:Uma2 family endonuclease